MSGTMKMRWLVCALALAQSMPAVPFAQNAGGPVIQIPVTTHDFGEVYKQDKFIHAFAVRNVGGADLVIQDVKPG
jgi:hypothetical protein